MQNKLRGNQGGFFRIIILIVIGLVLLRYYHLNVYDVLDWIKSLSLSKIYFFFVDLFKSVFTR